MAADLYVTGAALAPYLQRLMPLPNLARAALAALDAGGKVVVLDDPGTGPATVIRVVRTVRELEAWVRALEALVGAQPAPASFRLYEAPREIGQVDSLELSSRTVHAQDGQHALTHVLFSTPARVRADRTYTVVGPTGQTLHLAVERARRDGETTVAEGLRLG